jgi:TolB-like protein/Tfp pilus assembly protein PilF
MNSGNFFSELKRRNVYKVAVAYAVVGWLLVQVTTQVFPIFEIPNWALRLIVLAIIIGFPIALVMAWAFELTPEGIKRTEDVDLAQVRTKAHTWIYIVVVGAVVSISLFFVGRYTVGNKTTPRLSETATGSSIPQKSIAVLPFDNLSRDPDNAYFAEGVQDEILTRLAKVADLKVISRTSTQRFKSAPSDLREIARQLGVMHIVEGSVQKANDQVRVNVQLINALTDAHLWADTYDRKLTDIFSVESEIAKTIADMLQAKLTGSEKAMMAAQPTSDTAAYELYHKGRSLWQRRTGDNIPKAIAFYEQAIARDPNYALAYAGLADAYVLLPYYTGASQRDVYQKANEAARKALELDPNLAEAHTAVAKVLHFAEIDLPGSVREFQRAIELKPNYATAHHWLGSGPLIGLGHFEEASAHSRRAVELDPLSAIMNADLGVTLYLSRRYDEALAALRKAVELDPIFPYALYNLGLVLQAKGDLAGATAQFERARRYSDEPLIVALSGAVKTAAGDKDAARQALTELDRISSDSEVPAYARALLYVALNNKAEALHWLEQSFEDRDGSNLSAIKVDPLLDALHGDPRFEALVQKVVAPKT